jgi:hypothetical protein
MAVVVEDPKQVASLDSLAQRGLGLHTYGLG